jgi:TPR repeat protein
MIIIVKDRMRKQPQNSTSVSPLEKKASMGEVDAMIQLADQYDHIGEPQKAFLWYEKGAIAGDPGAMYMICRMYEAGRGVAQDHQLGAIWCQKARARTGIRGSW